MAVILTGCPPPCNHQTLDFGDLPEAALATVPYVDRGTYRFVHSAGQEITYTARRETTTETEYWHECSQVIFQKNTTRLTPDYPVFGFDLWIVKHDTASWSVSAAIGTSIFHLPMNHEHYSDYLFFDSLAIGGEYYRDVYQIKRSEGYNDSEDEIRPDSLWYNTGAGILKVSMNNGEFYQIDP